ncbi:hypothetical protein [Thalassococcus sp. S3]|nr:hypothetical protein [Thalassococcus sp. S3]
MAAPHTRYGGRPLSEAYDDGVKLALQDRDGGVARLDARGAAA